MEEKEIEKTDSTNGQEEVAEVVVDTTPEEEEEPKFTDAERKAFARAKVAEAKYKALKDSISEGTSKKSDGEMDYGQKAFLTTNGIKGAKEFDFVKAELKASGQDLETLLENDYFKSKLDKFRSLQQTADATPTGKRSSGVATESVEYWMTKPLEEVPKDMRIKVVNAQLAKEKSKGQFYNS